MTDFDILSAVIDLYERKKWNDHDIIENGESEITESLFKFLKEVGVSGGQFCRELLEEFLIVRNYAPYARQILTEIDEKLKTAERVFILPVKGEDDEQVKSGAAFVYEIWAARKKDYGHRLVQRDHPFSSDISPSPQDHILLIDDFIGSGIQFENMYTAFRQTYPNVPHSVRTIAIQEEGKVMIEGLGVGVKANYVRQKCISGEMCRFSMSQYNPKEIYLEIESLLDIGQFMSCGYMGSEALVTMKRTPDNTLPIFWETKRAGGGSWPAPFPRF